MAINGHPFHTFIELINTDQAIAGIENSIAKLQQEIQQLKDQGVQILLQLEQAKQAAHNERKQVDSRELETKLLDTQEKQKKERLDNATDHKQYQSLKKEIDTLKIKQHEYENVLFQAWNQLEAAQKQYDQINNDYPQQEADIKKNIDQKLLEIAQFQAKLDEDNEQRVEKEKLVPQEWLEKYAMLRARVSDPVVPIHQGSCSACFYRATEQDIMALRRRKLLQCKGCYRLLYSQEFETEEPTQTI